MPGIFASSSGSRTYSQPCRECGCRQKLQVLVRSWGASCTSVYGALRGALFPLLHGTVWLRCSEDPRVFRQLCLLEGNRAESTRWWHSWHWQRTLLVGLGTDGRNPHQTDSSTKWDWLVPVPLQSGDRSSGANGWGGSNAGARALYLSEYWPPEEGLPPPFRKRFTSSFTSFRGKKFSEWYLFSPIIYGEELWVSSCSSAHSWTNHCCWGMGVCGQLSPGQVLSLVAVGTEIIVLPALQGTGGGGGSLCRQDAFPL